MFGENFISRITNRTAEDRLSGDDQDHNIPKTPDFVLEIADALDTERNRNAIDLARRGINGDITPIFTMDTADIDDQDTPLAHDTERNALLPTENAVNIPTPRSLDGLRDAMSTYYKKTFDTTTIRASLERRNVDPSQYDAIITQLYDRMTRKVITTFTSRVTQELAAAGLDQKHAHAYILWRFTTLSENDDFMVATVANGEDIIANTFVTKDSVAQFLQEYDDRSDDTADPDHFTSRDIDDLLDRALAE